MSQEAEPPTERRRAEMEPGQAQALTDSILDSITDDFFVVDHSWRYTFLNRWAVSHAGRALGRVLTADALIGRSCWDTFPEWENTPVHDAYLEAVRDQGPVRLEGYLPGGDSWFEIRLYPSTSGVATYMCDITARKRASEQPGYYANLIANLEDAVVVTDTDGVVAVWNKGAEQMFGWTEAEAVGRRSHEVAGSPLSEAQVADALRELAATGRRRIEEPRYRRDGRKVITDALTVTLHDEQGEPAGFLGVLRDVTEYRRSARELERGINQQAAVAELGLRALRASSVPALMHEAAPLVRHTLGVQYAEIAEMVGARGKLVAVAGAGFGDAPIAPRAAGRSSPFGFVLVTGEPVLVEDLTAETRFSVPDALRQRGVLSLIAVVIDPAGLPFGTLAAMSTCRRSFSQSDISFLQSIANVLAAAIARAEAAEKLDTAREAERSRIARDLHDEALRELTDAHALSAMARPTGTSDDERIWTALNAALKRASRQLRAAVYDLRLSSSEARPFAELLDEVIAAQSDAAGGRHVELVGADALPAISLGPLGTETLRIVREAITNARQHSGATTVLVDASRSSSEFICLDINDDGAWPDRELAVRSRRGTGIAAMFERANAVGVDLRIGARPGGGTRVSVGLAVRDQDAEERERG